MGSGISKHPNKFHLLSSHSEESVDLTWMGWHPIHGAAYRGDVPEVRRLLASGAFYNTVDAAGRTPLHFARARRYGSRNDTVAKMLIHAGACDSGPLDLRGRSPLDVYIFYNKT